MVRMASLVGSAAGTGFPLKRVMCRTSEKATISRADLITVKLSATWFRVIHLLESLILDAS